MDSGNKPAIIYVTPGGKLLANRLGELFPGGRREKFSRTLISRLWQESSALIFIMATGIVLRTIAPLIQNKRIDPAVVVLDEKGRFAVSLLSGHLGGANKIAREIAAFLHGEAVITTASDVNDLTALDIWARDNRLAIEDWELVSKFSGRLVEQGFLEVYAEVAIGWPDDFIAVAKPGSADLLITNKKSLLPNVNAKPGRPRLYLRPRNLVAGIGLNSNTKAEEIEAALRATLEEHNLSFLSLKSLATIDRKAAEPGLLSLAGKYNLPLEVFSTSELNRVERVTRSAAAYRAMGVNAVAEPAALLAAGAGELLVHKQKSGNVTVALACAAEVEQSRKPAGNRPADDARPNLYVVGTGPGSLDQITPCARDAIAAAEVVVGYGVYLDQIDELIAGKEIVKTGMTEEVKRCQKAVELALAGKIVCVVSGGDPGIYAMAGLVLEILRDRKIPANRPVAEGGDSRAPWLKVEIIPGISALSACAARLGAPLMHDFAAISLSDRLTPWELIDERLAAAAKADFVIVIFNPQSRGRTRQINLAREILLNHRPPETPVGLVRGAFRENEEVIISNLSQMLNHPIDMQTTLVVGNSRTRVWDGRMITPRGYRRDG